MTSNHNYVSNNAIVFYKKDGRPIYINADSYGFYVIPDSDLAKLKGLKNIVDVRMGEPSRYVMPSKHRDPVLRLLSSTTHLEFAERFLTVCNLLLSIKGKPSSFRYLYSKLMVRLWSDGFILFPGGFLRGDDNSATSALFPNFNFPDESCGELDSLVGELEEGLGSLLKSEETIGRSARITRRFLCCIGPIKVADDLDQPVVDAMDSFLPTDMKVRQQLKNGMLALKNIIASTGQAKGFVIHPHYSASTAKSRHFKNLESGGNSLDVNLSGLKSQFEKDPTLKEWIETTTDWLSSLTGLKSSRTQQSIVRKFLTWLVNNPNVPRQPATFFKNAVRYTDGIISFFLENQDSGVSQQKILSAVSSMFDFALKQHCSEEEEGAYYLIPGHSNPIPKELIPSQDVLAGESTREVMPWFLMDLCRQIISENDFEWCRDPVRFPTDQITVTDSLGQPITIWNPVRAYAVLIMLNIPLRLYQVRMLDSGEGDEIKYDSRNYCFVDNVGKHAKHWAKTSKRRRNRGVINRITDKQTKKKFTGFYINTNKTKLRGKNFALETGYTIPWAKPEALELFVSLRNFQEQYNPVDGPLPYIKTLEEDNPTPDVLARTPDRFYLFRDLSSEINIEAPVTKGRIRSFWGKLMKELDLRLKQSGVLDGTDEFSVFVNGKSIYDIHCLRVSGLTTLAESGVDFQTLSKFIAGHSKLLMTLYYTKFNYEFINDELANAIVKAEANAQTQFRQILKSKTLDTAKKNLVAHSNVAFRQLATFSSTTWSFMDHGICPNGCSKCHEGSIFPIVDQKDRKIHGPVSDCAECRFLLTGTPFLSGLRAKCNERLLHVDEARYKLQSIQEEKQKLGNERIKCENEDRPFTLNRELIQAANNYNNALKDFNKNGDIVNKYKALITQTQALLKREKADDACSNDQNNFSLICQHGDFEAYIAEVSNYDFYDSICQSATFFKSVNPSVATLRRDKMFNAFLLRNKMKPLLDLPDELATKAITAASNLMRKRLGNETTNLLIEGSDSNVNLLDLDLELENAISEAIGSPYQLTPQIGDRSVEFVHRVGSRDVCSTQIGTKPLEIPPPGV